MTTTQLKRRIMLDSYPMEFSAAVTSLVGGMLFLVFPGVLIGTAVGTTLGDPFETLWSLAYAVGGGLVMWGFWRIDSKYQVAGLLTLACVFAINGYSIFAVRGPKPGLVSAMVLVSLCVGCTWRAWILSRPPRGR